jgi:uncharacterized phage protein (predicted DNA packaging)
MAVAILALADAKTYLRIDGDDFNADVQRAMASAEATIKAATGKMFDETNPIAVECALMLTSQFYDNRGGVQENRYSALDFGINNLLTTLQYWPEAMP